ncbi:hypothetical protein [Nocardia sp. CC227C]|uniref:hypothetical protein n=1 Tax=Nocardia sp. CC227C TaxID=3044562 RepID=UPI00278C094A|nr:hypothetical protein [Nocardia sp. CC227C]
MIRDVGQHRRFIGWGAPQLFVLLLTAIILWSTVLSARLVLAWHGGAAYRSCMTAAELDPANRLHRAMLENPARYGRFGHCYTGTLSSALQIALLWTVGYLIHARVQRTREHVADHDARAWGADVVAWRLLRSGCDYDRMPLRSKGFGPSLAFWRMHPSSAHRRRWLADSGMVDADHGRFAPNLLAVTAVMLMLTGIGRIGAAEGIAIAIVAACTVIAILMLLFLGGSSKGSWHHWDFSGRA